MNNLKFKIGNKIIGEGSTYFIIEEGQANQGNFDVALKMIEAAAKTGADAIEFQIAQADEFYIKSHIGYQIYKDREFSESQLKELVAYTKKHGLDLIVAPFSVGIINVMASYGCAAFNVNASDLNNPEILDAVIASGKPLFLSLLLAEENEIEWAVNRITNSSCSQFGLLLGQHTMASGKHGVDLKHTNFGYLNTLKQKYKTNVGFIDHSANIWTPACAVAFGAGVITKHLAISRSEKGPDWHVCLEPEEMKESINLVREINQSIPTTHKTLAPGENMDRSKMRRSLVTTKTLDLGHILTRGDITFKRPGTGISLSDIDKVIGKQLTKIIEKDQLLSFDDIQ